MDGFIILSILITVVFGSMFIFGFMGYRAMRELGKRPMRGGNILVPLVFKLAAITAVLIFMLVFVMELFG